jgi:hypothetical protein
VKILRDLDPDLVAVVVATAVCLAAGLQVPMLLILGVAVPISIFAKLSRRRA